MEVWVSIQRLAINIAGKRIAAWFNLNIVLYIMLLTDELTFFSRLRCYTSKTPDDFFNIIYRNVIRFFLFFILQHFSYFVCIFLMSQHFSYFVCISETNEDREQPNVCIYNA